jgi:hypothetical protein
MSTLENKIKNASIKLLKNVDATSTLLVNTMNENHEDLKSNLNEKMQALEDLTSEKFTGMDEKIDEIDNKTIENLKGLSRQVDGVRKDVTENVTNIKNLHVGTTNMMDDMQTNTIREFQEGIGGLMKQNLDNFENINNMQSANLADLTTKLNDSKDDLTSVVEATNEHLDKIYEKLQDDVQKSNEDVKNEILEEITDLRSTILSTIRNDIELMKSVVNKIDSKTI